MKTILALLSLTAFSYAGSMNCDSDKSWLKLDCKATGHSWTSKLKKFNASVAGDPTTLVPSAVNFSWRFSDIDSDEADRDKKMLEWLDAGKNPSGSWTMTSTWTDKGQTYVKGPLKIHGVSKEIVIPVKAAKKGESISIDGDVWIDTTDYNLPIVKVLLLSVNPKVHVIFHLEGAAS